MKRVAVIGSGGAGKSTFARQLGERTGLPVIHLDRLFWHPGWVPTPDDEWEAMVREVAQGERWIIDGNYGGTMQIRLDAADTVVYLDLPRLVCLWSVLRRRFSSARHGRPDIADGISDKLELSFLRWIWDFPRTRRPQILAQLAALPSATSVHRLASRREMRAFLDAAVPEAVAA